MFSKAACAPPAQALPGSKSGESDPVSAEFIPAGANRLSCGCRYSARGGQDPLGSLPLQGVPPCPQGWQKAGS